MVIVMDSWFHFASHSGLKVREYEIQEICTACGGLDVLCEPMGTAHVFQFGTLWRVMARETEPFPVVHVEVANCQKRDCVLRIDLVFLLKPSY